MAEENAFRISVTGDSMVTGAIPFGKDFEETYELIEGADVAFTNLEVPLHDNDVHAVANKGSIYFSGPPRAADDLKRMGFNLIGAANNHVGDYSQGGMRETIAVLEDRGLAYAGLGENLTRARAPTFLNTQAGRVALIAATTTFVPGTEAGDEHGDIPGRPGVSPLRLQTSYVVSDSSFEAIQRISEELNLDRMTKHRSSYLSDTGEDTFDFLSVGSNAAGEFVSFERGGEPRVRQALTESDVTDLLRQVDWARHQADTVLVSVHSHEGRDGRYSHPSVPEFLEELARRCINEGADMFLSHGPHQLRGIEMYRGKPIFYSLGNFIAQQNGMTRFPADSYRYLGLPDTATPADVYRRSSHSDEDGFYDVFYEPIQSESVIPVCVGRIGEFDRIELHPLDLGSEFSNALRGLPRLARDRRAVQTLEHIRKKSRSFGTEIEIEGETGIISL